MNYKYLLTFASLFFIFSCSSSPEEQAHELVEKSIEAHNLSKNWQDLAAIKFKKWTRVLDENGNVQSEFEQWVEFRLKPYFEGKLTWTKDSVLHVANFNGSKMTYQMGSNEIQNKGFLNVKRAEIEDIYSAFAQPWHLLDENVNVTYEGQKTLTDGEILESVRVNYSSDETSSWIYFDPTSAKVVANELHAKDNNRMIKTISYDESTGFLLAKEQKSFRIDEAGENLFLQAEYLYSDYQVTFE